MKKPKGKDFHIPTYTCPSIDRIIDKLEELRADNRDLRQAAIGYKDYAEELESYIEELQDYNEALVKIIEELNKE